MGTQLVMGEASLRRWYALVPGAVSSTRLPQSAHGLADKAARRSARHVTPVPHRDRGRISARVMREVSVHGAPGDRLPRPDGILTQVRQTGQGKARESAGGKRMTRPIVAGNTLRKGGMFGVNLA